MVDVRESTIIDAPSADVWRLLRDFNSHHRWHPAIAASHIEGEGAPDAVRAVRNFRLADGGQLREQLISISDRDTRLSYCLLEAPVPLHNYVAHMRLRPVTDRNACYLEWWSRFDPPAGEVTAMVELVRDGVYRAGFAALQDWFGGVPQQVKPVPLAQSAQETVHPKPRAGHARGIFVESHGGPQNMVSKTFDIPRPGAGEALITQNFAGVNFIDIHTRTGHFNLIRPPAILGMEAVGRIEMLGPDAQGIAVGSRVGYACAPPGAYCSHRVMPLESLVVLPDGLSDAQAAASLLRGVTTSFLTREVHRIGDGENVLIHAAAGGLGQLLAQVCVALGARVIATVGSAEGLVAATESGAHHVINYRRSDFVREVLDLTDGRGVDVVYDAVGAFTFEGSLRAAAIRGHVVSFGEASGEVGIWDIGSFSAKSLRVSRPNYAHYVDRFIEHASTFFALIEKGAVRVPDPTEYRLEDAGKAHIDVENRAIIGAAVLRI